MRMSPWKTPGAEISPLFFVGLEQPGSTWLTPKMSLKCWQMPSSRQENALLGRYLRVSKKPELPRKEILAWESIPSTQKDSIQRLGAKATLGVAKKSSFFLLKIQEGKGNLGREC